ncbi:MAG: M48 family metalloprotease, partial [Rhodospirillales bacterium]
MIKRSILHRLSVLLLALALAPVWALAGCTVNPATGEQSFTAFMSPQQEIDVGRGEHPKIVKQFGGAYGDTRFTSYVQTVGLKLARVSDMPDLAFTITVLNDPTVNAFALPGGFVYITRGLLALAENEAEMAGGLALEIGHVTA